MGIPKCIGAIDGKHVVIQAPPSSGSQYWNYKGTFSIVLMAVVDAHYRFLVVDVGAYGRSSDGGILVSSAFGTAMRNGILDHPEDKLLPGADHLGHQPHAFVADEAFPLRRDILRPYPGQQLTAEKRVFNFRLSHGVWWSVPLGYWQTSGGCTEEFLGLRGWMCVLER